MYKTWKVNTKLSLKEFTIVIQKDEVPITYLNLLSIKLFRGGTIVSIPSISFH